MWSGKLAFIVTDDRNVIDLGKLHDALQPSTPLQLVLHSDSFATDYRQCSSSTEKAAADEEETNSALTKPFISHRTAHPSKVIQ